MVGLLPHRTLANETSKLDAVAMVCSSDPSQLKYYTCIHGHNCHSSENRTGLHSAADHCHSATVEANLTSD